MIKIRAVVNLGFPLILPVLLVAWLALATGLAAAAPGDGAGTTRQFRQAGRFMALTQDAGARHGGIPSLDLTVPAKFETATFALG